ncbi:tubulin-like doman-containing protein [Crocosphaera sp. UHCC 0190]|uniref:tubulin-like doman-containing protein n=1 Tax=Crocosphaera sp. UHCC 0190 TaxID=3110246 RepID=UPI002B205079|nr:tubulin-like doman-containing protein [Crocosphaera sp. UHCC 0190]MEA5510887.1 tubulin-like doman-containing protein [Crocosphaera sp. UHCC 0190]
MIQEQQTRAIKRTICIGLGGTGRDVLMRIRRFIIDKYGKLNQLPVISFVQIDTDKDSFNSSGLPTGNTYHGEEILFRDAEKVITSMTSQDVDNLLHELEHPTLFEGAYSHIESWFHPQLKGHVKAIEDGAHGIRPVGRLAFFHNYRTIKTAIENAENRTRGHEEFLLKKRLNVQQGLDIFIVGSLCGGTGSGLFLDVAYTVRNLYKKNSQIFGYLMISSALFGDTPIMNANTYAALKELNYYTSENTKFEACYDKQYQSKISESRPPFDYTYLLSNQTSGDYKINEKGKLCNVIAYKIFLEFSSDLASKLQGQRNNFKDPMLRTDDHPFKMCQQYLTFGLSAIYFTRDRLVQIALNRLTLKLVNFWLEGIGQSPEANTLIEGFLLKWTSNINADDCIINKLKEATQDNNKSFEKSLKKWQTSLENLEFKKTEDIDIVKQDLPRGFRSEFRKVQDGKTESSRGIWLTNLKNNQSIITDNLTQDIDSFLADLLNPNNENFSINNSLAFLEALKTKLAQYQRSFETKKQELKGMYSDEKIEQIWAEAKQEIEDIEQKSKLPFLNSRKFAQIKEVILTTIRHISRIIKHNFEVAANDESIKIIETLQTHVSTRLNQVYSFSDLLQKTNYYYQKKEEELRQLNLDEMSGEAIFPEADIDSCIPNNGSQSQLVSVTYNIAKELSFGDSLLSLLTTNLVDQSQLQTKTDLVIERLFSSLGFSQVQSVIKRFLENYSISDRPRRLEQILQSAKPLLSLNLSDPRFYNGKEKNSQLIGFKQTDDIEVKQFKDMLINQLGIPETSFKPIQAEDEILFITEYAAFPLRIVNDITRMKDHYQQQVSQGILHNNHQIMFTDIIPHDAKIIKEIEYIFYPCIALNLLEYNQETQRYEFPYYDELHRTHYTASLSYSWREALEQLASRQDMTEMIKTLLDQAVSQIKANPNLMKEQYYSKIQKFVMNVESLSEHDPNFFYKSQVIGQRATTETPAKEGIITRFIAQIENQIKQQQSQISNNNLLSYSDSKQSGNQTSLPLATIQNHQNTQSDGMKALEKLISMKENGFLTDEQFEAAKTKLLGL